MQISRASTTPESSYIAKPAASWLDDFLVWLSPEAFGCCRKFVNGSYCPPDDQVGVSSRPLFSVPSSSSPLSQKYPGLSCDDIEEICDRCQPIEEPLGIDLLNMIR